MSVALSTKPTSYFGSQVSIATLEMSGLMPGWQFFRQNLSARQLDSVRGETLYLTFWVRFQGDPDNPWNIHLDDVRAVAVREYTESAPLPATLNGDDTQPLLVVGTNGDRSAFAIQRMDTDGSNRVVLAESNAAPQALAWSPDGSQFVYSSNSPFPLTLTDPNQFPAEVSETYLMAANGGPRQQIFHTTGAAGRKESPARLSSPG